MEEVYSIFIFYTPDTSLTTETLHDVSSESVSFSPNLY